MNSAEPNIRFVRALRLSEAAHRAIWASDLQVLWAHESPTPLEIPGANLIFDALAAHAAA